MRVAAEPGREPEARLHAAEVLPRQRATHRAALAQPPLAGGPGARGGARIAGEHRVLLADQPEAGSVQHPPERRQLRRDRPSREHVRGLRPPDQALQRPVAEHRPAEGQPTQRAAGQLAVRLARPPRALGDDLVELPGVGDRAGSQRVAEARTELDAPGDSRGRRQPQQLRELRQRAGQALRARVVREQLLLGARVEPPALPEPPGLDVEHRRVAPLRQLVNARGDAGR